MESPITTREHKDYMIEVYYDDTCIDYYINDIDFESEKQKREYAKLFETGRLNLYCILVKNICKCCNQPNEIVDSLRWLDFQFADEALDYYIKYYFNLD